MIRYCRIIGHGHPSKLPAETTKSALNHMIGSAVGTMVKNPNEYEIEVLTIVPVHENEFEAIMIGKFPLKKEYEPVLVSDED